jgi:type VI protein secretion system component Hcp
MITRSSVNRIAIDAPILAQGRLTVASETHDASRRTILKGSALGAGALLGAAALPGSAHAAAAAKPANPAAGGAGYFLTLQDTFRKVDTETIQLSSFSFGASRGASDGSAGSRGAEESVFHFSAPATIASPTLMLLTVSGREVPAVQLTAKDANQVTFLKITLSEVIVSSYEVSGPADNIPTDSAVLSYGKIAYSYYPVNVDGKPGTPNSITWNVRTEKYSG